MRIQEDLYLPENFEAFDNPRTRTEFLKSLYQALKNNQFQLSQAINGQIGGSSFQNALFFEPTVTGSTGVNGAETYSKRTAWYLRQGNVVDYWVDIAYTGHTGTGNTQISLPYRTAITDNQPFTCSLMVGTTSYTTNYTQTGWTAVSDSLTAEVLETGSGQTLQNLPMSSAASFTGHIRYIGKLYERT